MIRHRHTIPAGRRVLLVLLIFCSTSQISCLLAVRTSRNWIWKLVLGKNHQYKNIWEVGRDQRGMLENRLQVDLTGLLQPFIRSMTFSTGWHEKLSSAALNFKHQQVELIQQHIYFTISYIFPGQMVIFNMLLELDFSLRQGESIFCGYLCALSFTFFLSSNRNAHLSLNFPGWLLPRGSPAVT